MLSVPITQLIILALVQGITEFLPISSSAHLILVPLFMDWMDQGLVIDLALHFGTLFAVLLYYRSDVAMMLRAVPTLFRPTASAADTGDAGEGRRLIWALLVGTIPIILVGGLLVMLDRDEMMRTAEVIGWTSIIFGLFLYWADRFTPERMDLGRMTPWRGFIIGLSQLLAIIPGTSRAGITMTAGRFLGFDRLSAARFSMLLAVPTILASSAGGVLKLVKAGDVALTTSAVIAAVLAFVAAYVTIMLFMRWLRHASMTPFVVYRVALGLLLLGWVYL